MPRAVGTKPIHPAAAVYRQGSPGIRFEKTKPIMSLSFGMSGCVSFRSVSGLGAGTGPPGLQLTERSHLDAGDTGNVKKQSQFVAGGVRQIIKEQMGSPSMGGSPRATKAIYEAKRVCGTKPNSDWKHWQSSSSATRSMSPAPPPTPGYYEGVWDLMEVLCFVGKQR